MIRVASYNIWAAGDFSYTLQTGKERRDPAPFACFLQDENVDICCLNEVRDYRPSGGRCQADEIARLAGFGYVHFTHALELDGYRYGNALVSRYPIRVLREIPLVLPETQRSRTEYYEDRVLTVAEIAAPEGALTVAFCHFGLSSEDWNLAVSEILPIAKSIRTPFILAGDFNLEPNEKPYAVLASVLCDAAAGKGYLTFPSNAPEKKIDYIFVNDRLRVLDCRVPNVMHSDHRPIIADLETE